MRMKRRALVSLLLAPLAYALIRAAAVARVRRYETLDADTADLPGVRLFLRGRRIHVAMDGQGPPLLMLHGFGSSGAALRPLFPYLRNSMTVIAPDLPGWGYSERSPQADHSHQANAALMLELLDRLGIHSAVVLGHGTGADIAHQMRRAAPERVLALVLSNVPRCDPAVPSWFRAILVPVAPLIVETRRGQRLIQRAVRVPGQRLNEQLVTAHLDEARTVGHVATLLAIVTHRRPVPAADLRPAPIPSLLISDQETPDGIAAAIFNFVQQREGASTERVADRSLPNQGLLGAN
jgi:pimeloyl-ACP methyl ester carboxylesterase